jgi:hypothetical protein
MTCAISFVSYKDNNAAKAAVNPEIMSIIPSAVDPTDFTGVSFRN